MYYFKLRGDDPIETAWSEEQCTKEELHKAYVGSWLQTGEEEHDMAQIIGIMTSEEAAAYFAS